jgi:hypothetical protein
MPKVNCGTDPFVIAANEQASRLFFWSPVHRCKDNAAGRVAPTRSERATLAQAFQAQGELLLQFGQALATGAQQRLVGERGLGGGQ